MDSIAGLVRVEHTVFKLTDVYERATMLDAHSEKLTRAFASPTCLSMRSRDTARSLAV